MAKPKAVEEIPFELSEENPFGPVTHIDPPKLELAKLPPPPIKRVLITGSRSHWEFDLIKAFCAEVVAMYPEAEFIHGGAAGVDCIAGYVLTNTFKKKVTKMPADWGERMADGTIEHPDAGVVRNWQMVMKVQAVAALWDGESRGTKHAIAAAKRMNRPVNLWNIPAVPNPNPWRPNSK